MFSFFFSKQTTAYEMRISDWSSDVCSSDLTVSRDPASRSKLPSSAFSGAAVTMLITPPIAWLPHRIDCGPRNTSIRSMSPASRLAKLKPPPVDDGSLSRSEEHTSELQSLMRISYAVFCLKKKKNNNTHEY